MHKYRSLLVNLQPIGSQAPVHQGFSSLDVSCSPSYDGCQWFGMPGQCSKLNTYPCIKILCWGNSPLLLEVHWGVLRAHQKEGQDTASDVFLNLTPAPDSRMHFRVPSSTNLSTGVLAKLYNITQGFRMEPTFVYLTSSISTTLWSWAVAT